MSETMRELLPVLFMFGCVFALGPLVGGTLWMMHDGDRLRDDQEAELETGAAASSHTHESAQQHTAQVA